MTFKQFCIYSFKLSAIMSAIYIAIAAIGIGAFAIKSHLDDKKTELEEHNTEVIADESDTDK